MEETKSTKLIGIGNEGIKKLEEVESKIAQKIDTEKININKDVDKDYVRALLDGVDILLLTYNSEDKGSLQIVNAIGYMADERRVLCIGLDLNHKEKKNEIKINREIKINNENTDEAVQALQILGYNKNEIAKTLEKINNKGLSTEDIIKQALKYLARQ